MSFLKAKEETILSNKRRFSTPEDQLKIEGLDEEMLYKAWEQFAEKDLTEMKNMCLLGKGSKKDGKVKQLYTSFHVLMALLPIIGIKDGKFLTKIPNPPLMDFHLFYFFTPSLSDGKASKNGSGKHKDKRCLSKLECNSTEY